MTVKVEEVFNNDVNGIFDAKLLRRIDNTVDSVIEARTVRDIHQLIKLKGYRFYYRIRIGDYRIGVTIIGDTVTFERCLPRKDFYRSYPPK